MFTYPHLGNSLCSFERFKCRRTQEPRQQSCFLYLRRTLIAKDCQDCTSLFIVSARLFAVMDCKQTGFSSNGRRFVFCPRPNKKELHVESSQLVKKPCYPAPSDDYPIRVDRGLSPIGDWGRDNSLKSVKSVTLSNLFYPSLSSARGSIDFVSSLRASPEALLSGFLQFRERLRNLFERIQRVVEPAQQRP